MIAFEYARTATVKEALALLGTEWGRTELLAGGTDLLSLMKDAVANPTRVVSLQGIKELHAIELKAGSGLRVGATTTFQELIDHPGVAREYPALVEAAKGVTSPQLRNMGTVGGDLLQRPRCWYFRAGYGLLARQNGQFLAPQGENQYDAILGNEGPAYFVNPSSLAPILIALGAKVHIQGPRRSRKVDLSKFFVNRKGDERREYDLSPNEILTNIEIPPRKRAQMAVYEVRQKEALDWPLGSAAVVLYLKGQKIRRARVVLGHVAPIPWQSREAEEALKGKVISESIADAAGKAAVSKATPLSKNAYKVQLARVAVKRAVLAAAKGVA